MRRRHRSLPPVIPSGLVGYYRMAGDAGIACYDSSGCNNHGTLGVSGANLPTRTAAGYSFNNSVISLPTHIFTGVKTIQVACNVQNGVNSQVVLSVDSTDQALRLATTTGQACVGPYPNPTTIGGTPIRGPNLITWRIGRNRPTEVDIWINDKPEVSYPFGPGLHGMSATAGDSKLYLGWINGANPGFLDSFYTVLLYNKYLQDDEIPHNYVAIANDLARRGIILGDTWPANSNQLIGVGDSIIGSVGVASSAGNAGLMLPLVNSLTNSVRATNLGIPGIAIQTYQTTLRKTVVDPILPQTTGAIKAVIMDGGTNDAFNSVQSASAIYGFIKSLATALKAAGATHVGYMTITPRADTFWTGAMETTRLAINSSARADYTNNPVGLIYTGTSQPLDFIYDAASEPAIQNPSTDTTNYADKLHFTAAGDAILAAGFKQGLVLCGIN